NAGPAETLFYEPRGNEATTSIYSIDGSIEATFNVYQTIEFGVKGEVFNITDMQRQTNVSNLTWCDNASAAPTSSCGIARAMFGTATARNAYQAPRSYRLTALVRF